MTFFSFFLHLASSSGQRPAQSANKPIGQRRFHFSSSPLFYSDHIPYSIPHIPTHSFTQENKTSINTMLTSAPPKDETTHALAQHLSPIQKYDIMYQIERIATICESLEQGINEKAVGEVRKGLEKYQVRTHFMNWRRRCFRTEPLILLLY